MDRTSPGLHRQAGTTLVELLITMTVLGLFLAMFSTAFLSLTKAVRRQTGQVDAQSATRLAFEILDKQIRYADGVTTPSTGDPQWVEWQVPDPAIPVAQSSTQSRCFQWQASAATGVLRYRSWVVPTSGTVGIPPWIPVASGLVIGTVPVFTTSATALQAAPFGLPATGQTYTQGHPQVGVALSVSLNNPAGRSAARTVFTALNSSTVPGTACGQVARS